MLACLQSVYNATGMFNVGNPMESICTPACLQSVQNTIETLNGAIQWSQSVPWHAAKACKTPSNGVNLYPDMPPKCVKHNRKAQ